MNNRYTLQRVLLKFHDRVPFAIRSGFKKVIVGFIVSPNSNESYNKSTRTTCHREIYDYSGDNGQHGDFDLTSFLYD